MFSKMWKLFVADWYDVMAASRVYATTQDIEAAHMKKEVP
jgi:hypothetical protein